MSVSIKEPVVKDKTYKFCPKCSEIKPVNEFYKNATSFDGLQGYCKKCRQESGLLTGGKRYGGLHKRSYPLDGKCELCNAELGKSCYHHFNDNNLNLGLWICHSCDYLAEGLDEIGKNPWKVNIYRRLRKEVEEAERTYKYLGPFKPPDGIHRLFFNGEQTYRWCPHCGIMKPVKDFHQNNAAYGGLSAYCKKCEQAYSIGYQGKGVCGLHKRPKSTHCELCNGKTFLAYHHWDNNNKSKGVWVCQTNKCHNLVEVVDKLDKGSLLPNKYYELKQRIILGSRNNAPPANIL